MKQTARKQADVVVVGGGGSGLAAALEARAHGASVLLLEKNPQLGGTTRLSVGSLAACCTPYQRRRGIQDSPEEFFEDMGLFSGPLAERENLELRRLLANKSSETLEWLMAMGIEFFGPMPEPPNRYPRMHNVLPNSASYIYNLSRQARKRGIEIQVGISAKRLLRENGRITAVQAEDPRGEQVQIVARKGIVLATGDYSSGRELKAKLVSAQVADIEGINPTSTGDGHRMAMEVGARVVNGDCLLGPEIRFVAPGRKLLVELLPPVRPLARVMSFLAANLPDALLRPFILAFMTAHLAPTPKLFSEGAVLVNSEGRRFCNELEKPALSIPKQPERIAYICFDQQVAQKFSQWPNFISTAPGISYAYLADYRRNRKDIFYRGRTLERLAAKLNVPAGALADSVAEYNRLAANEGHDAFGRGPAGEIREPPFYALGPAKGWVVLTDGGLAVTTGLEVLDGDDNVIPGLYAAGSAGQGGVFLEGHGMHLCWAFTSGRIAGSNAAAG